MGQLSKARRALVVAQNGITLTDPRDTQEKKARQTANADVTVKALLDADIDTIGVAFMALATAALRNDNQRALNMYCKLLERRIHRLNRVVDDLAARVATLEKLVR